MTTGVMSPLCRQKGNKKTLKNAAFLSPLWEFYRRYQQAAEIRNVASGSLRTRRSDVIRNGEFLVCILCLSYLPFLPQRWAEKTVGYFQQGCINPSISLQQNIPTGGRVPQSSWQVSLVTVLRSITGLCCMRKLRPPRERNGGASPLEAAGAVPTALATPARAGS